MTDREKTIKGLWDIWKCMINKLDYKEAKPFFYAIDEAVNALKEQEAVEPNRGLVKTQTAWFCGACGFRLNRAGRFCPKCGRSVKWE